MVKMMFVIKGSSTYAKGCFNILIVGNPEQTNR